ncbi:MAG: hypothetical protein HY279_00370 [Nitrospinae bacterium]|nr:hypothetical protein [Nitrospinota bacterium]
MAIFTPGGLKIRLPLEHCFALIARLYPNVDAFKLLKTTEGFEIIPAFLSFITGIICFIFAVEPLWIGLYVFISSIIGFFITLTIFAYRIPILPTLSTLFSYAYGFGIYWILIAVAGFVIADWKRIIAYFVGAIMANFVKMAIDLINSNRLFKKFALYVSGSEINFYNAYLWHATKLGKSLDLTISDDELKRENWNQAFEDLAVKWPEVVNRFTID